MNVRFIATICCFALLGSGFSGCAVNPPREADPAVAAEPMNLDRLPQIMLPGAIRSEVKSFAMGAARSKGWTITQSSADRLVIQQDAKKLVNLAPGASGSTIGPGSRLEVTSYFIEQSGGVKVASKAELVNPTPGEKGPTRTDYTENFRDSLTQSLTSLRNSWSENRGRIARATPPADGWADAWGNRPTGAAASANPASEPATRDNGQTEAIRTVQPQPPKQPAPPVYAAQPAPQPVTESNPQPSQWIAERPAPLRSAPEPRYLAAGAAPVVDATTNAPAATSATSAPAAPKPPSAPPNAIPRQDNMMALPSRSPVAGSVSWAAYAEQYARQRGCQVGGLGTELIESRTDGEVHKVPCVGSDSFLVKCQNGTCQGLL